MSNRGVGDARFADRFELKATVGNGGMGAVYKALDRKTGQLVAIKVLHSRNTIELARFEQEASVLSELSHPGIVRYLDHGVTPEGSPYIAMEWLEGETLEDRMARGKLDPASAAHVAGLVLKALAAAHACGIVHRDIKPSNIFLVGWKLNEVRVLDFGIARRVFDPKRFTRKGFTVGTPLYTSPEQARGRADVDGRSDIFSLGCVFFEVLTGEPPFTGDTPLEVMTRVCQGRVPPISSRLPGVPAELEALVHSMLAPQPAARPNSAAELARRFQEVSQKLGGLEEEAAPPRQSVMVKAGTLGLGEEHLFCAMLVSLARRPADAILPRAERRLGPRPAPAGPNAPARIPVPTEENVRTLELHQILDAFSCSMDPLTDRTLLVSAHSACTAEEQAMLLAQAALALRDIEPDARMVIGTGRAEYVGRLPEGRLMEHLPNLLQGQPPGCIRVDSTTHRLLPTRFAVSGPKDHLLLLAETSSAGSDRPRELRGQQSPFVGRERSMATLHSLWRECSEDRKIRTAVILGDCGLGKTRLVREFIASLTEKTPAVLRAGGCLVGEKASYPTLRPLFAAANVDLLGNPPPVLEDPLCALMEQREEARGLLLVLEDLHWADAASITLMDQVMTRMRGHRVLLIVTGRPEVEDRFPGLFGTHSPEHMRLRPLTGKQGEGIIRTHLPHADRGTMEFILDRWGGNPRFLEEMCLSALEGPLGVPEALQAAVEDRFGALEPDVRRLLRSVSLFGDKPVPEKAIVALLGESVRKGISEWFEILVMREFLVRETDTGQAMYRFREKIVREAAYRMLTPKDRVLARTLARTWLEAEGCTLPETLTAPLSQTSSLAVNG